MTHSTEGPQGSLRLRRIGFPVLTPALATLVVYLPNSLRRSAWSDDFQLMDGDAIDKMYADGRPILAMLYETVFPNNIGDLAVLRAVGVVGIAALASLLTVLLMRWGASGRDAAIWSTSAIFLPTFHTYANWATVFAVPWISLIAVAAGAVWIEGAQSSGGFRRAAAIVAMTLAMLSYPPAAMFCWVPLGLRILLLRTRPTEALGAVMRLGLLVLGTGLTALLIAPVARNIRGVPIDARVQTLTSFQEVIGKLIWFVSHPVVVAARPFNIESPEPLAALATAGPLLTLTGIGLLCSFRGPVLSRFATLSTVALCCALTMAPHLLVPDNQIEYRYMGGLTVLVWGCICVAIHRLVELGSVRLTPRLHKSAEALKRHLLPIAAFVLLLPLTASLAIANVRQTFIEPSVSKERFLLDALAGFDPSIHSQILIINHQELWKSRSDLGIYSTTSDLAHGWVAEPNIRMLLVETRPQQSVPVLMVVRDEVKPGAGDYVVDLRQYARSFNP